MKFITKKDYLKALQMAKQKKEEIPVAHCRKREEAYHRTIIQLISDGTGRKEGKPSRIVYVRNENLGNKRFPYIIPAIYTVDFKKCRETEKCYIFEYVSGHRDVIRKDTVVALVK